MKRILSLLLVLLTVFPLLASCGGNNTPKLPEKVTLENVYTAEKIALPAEITENCYDYSLGNFSPAGDGKLIFRVNRTLNSVNEQGYNTYVNENLVYLYSLHDGSFKKLFDVPDQYRYDPEKMEATNNYLNAIMGMSDGFWCSFNSYYENWSDPENFIYENKTLLKKYDFNGNLVKELDLLELIGQEKDQWGNTIVPYVSQILTLPNGNTAMLDSRAIYIFSPELKFVKKISATEEGQDGGQFNGMGLLGDRLAVLNYDENWNLVLSYVDTLSGEITSAMPEGMKYLNNYPNFSSDGRLYSQDTVAYCTYDLNTFEKIPVINWINSSINNNRISGVTAVGDKFIASEWDSEYTGQNLLLLSPVGEVVEKYVITYACIYLDYEMKEQIIEFNRTHPEHCIQVKDYSEYNTQENEWTGAATQLDLDILSGKCPDIIDLNSIDFEKYAKKGLLADMYQLINADSERPLSAYHQNILKSGEYKGKLYAFIPNFSLTTLAAKTSIVGSGTRLTFEDMERIQREYPEASLFEINDRASMLSQLFMANFDYYIDYENVRCNFADGSFEKLLTFCASFPEEINWDEIYGEDYNWQLEESKYKENRTIFQTAYLSSFEDIRYIVESFGEDITYIGYPTSADSGTTIQPSARYGISATTPFLDEAWGLVKDTVDLNDWNFSVLRSVNEERANAAMQPPEQDDYYYGGGAVVTMPAVRYVLAEPTAVLEAVEEVAVEVSAETTAAAVTTTPDIITPDIPISDDVIVYEPEVYYWNRALTQAEVDMIFRTIDGATTAYRTNNDILDIVKEVTAPFFAGQKSAEEVCKIAQSRITIYISENS